MLGRHLCYHYTIGAVYSDESRHLDRYSTNVSVIGPLAYEPNTLPLRQWAKKTWVPSSWVGILLYTSSMPYWTPVLIPVTIINKLGFFLDQITFRLHFPNKGRTQKYFMWIFIHKIAKDGRHGFWNLKLPPAYQNLLAGITFLSSIATTILHFVNVTFVAQFNPHTTTDEDTTRKLHILLVRETVNLNCRKLVHYFN